MVSVYTVQPTEVNPDSKLPKTVKLVSQRPSLAWQMRVHQTLIYFASIEGGGVVWDFETGLYTVVPNVERYGVVELMSLFYLGLPLVLSRQVAFTGNFAFYYADDRLLLWSVPALTLDVPHSRRIPIPHGGVTRTFQKCMIYSYPFSCLPQIGTVVSLHMSCSHPHISFPIAIETVIPPGEGEDHFELSRYFVDVTFPDSESLGHQIKGRPALAFELKTKCMLLSPFYSLSRFKYRSPLEFGYSSRDLRYLGSTNPALRVLSVTHPHRSEPRCLTGKNAAVTTLYLNEEDEADAGILCLYSGRLVFVESMTIGDAVSVVVVDYLSE